MGNSDGDKKESLSVKSSEIEKRILRAIPKGIFAPFKALKLRFISTPENEIVNMSDSGVWHDGDKKFVDYNSAVAMLERQYPKNFRQIGKPMKEEYIIGQILRPVPQIETQKFQKIHDNLGRVLFDLDTLANDILGKSAYYKPLAFCDYNPVRGWEYGKVVSYKDLEHLRLEAIKGIKTIRLLKDHIGKNKVRISNGPEPGDELQDSIFMKVDKVYNIRFRGGKSHHVKNLRGMAYLHEILSNKGKSIPFEDLLCLGRPEAEKLIRTRVYPDNGLEKMKSECLKGIQELNGKIEEAQKLGNLREAENADRERAEIIRELSRKFTRSGKPRAEIDDVRKGISSIRNTIRNAYKEIDGYIPEMVVYLRRQIIIAAEITFLGDIDWQV